MKNARGGMDAFPFLLRRFSAWEAPAGVAPAGASFVHQGLKKTKGLNGTFFCASSTEGGPVLPGTWAKSMAELA